MNLQTEAGNSVLLLTSLYVFSSCMLRREGRIVRLLVHIAGFKREHNSTINDECQIQSAKGLALPLNGAHFKAIQMIPHNLFSKFHVSLPFVWIMTD